MTYLLPSNDHQDSQVPVPATVASVEPVDMTDLKIFWGPEICRLEYLLHLLDTGRVKDERRTFTAPAAPPPMR